MSGAINSLNDFTKLTELTGSPDLAGHTSGLTFTSLTGAISLFQHLNLLMYLPTLSLSTTAYLPIRSTTSPSLTPACLGYDGKGSVTAIPSFRKLVPKPHTLIPVYRIVWQLQRKRSRCSSSPTVSTTSDFVRTVVVCEELYGVFWTGVGAYSHPHRVSLLWGCSSIC